MESKYCLMRSFKTFVMKEMKRFIKVWGQTIVGPIITTSLFLLVFSVAIGRTVNADDPYTYAQFIVPGLIMMAVIQNAFANSSSSLIIAKINNNIVDILMAPLTPSLVIGGYLLGSILRGVMVGLLLFVYLFLFVDIKVHNFFWMLYFIINASALLGLIGIIAGVVCVKFDQLAHFTNFIITPLSFLSGTFYSMKQLPESIQFIAHYNPVFYAIDGFRYSFLGISDFNLMLEASVLLLINIILFAFATLLWKKGYKLKS